MSATWTSKLTMAKIDKIKSKNGAETAARPRSKAALASPSRSRASSSKSYRRRGQKVDGHDARPPITIMFKSPDTTWRKGSPRRKRAMRAAPMITPSTPTHTSTPNRSPWMSDVAARAWAPRAGRAPPSRR